MEQRFQGMGSYHDRIFPADELTEVPDGPHESAYPVRLPDGDWAELPFLTLPPAHDSAIAYLCITENSFELEDRLSSAMAEIAAGLHAEVVVGMPTLGMVLAASVAKKLGHPHYVPLSYSKKFWFTDELSEPVRSITSPDVPKTVYIDPRMLERLKGKRVVLVEDVISTGGTVLAELRMMRRLGVDVVGVVTAIKETNVWETKLSNEDPAWPALVHAPISLPLFRRADGGWVPDPATAPSGT